MSDTRNYANCMGNEGGTPVYLEDKRLSESASQSTLASTDAIMLKGTDGTYHEIARDSLVEAVRSVMGGILKNLDKGTTIGALAALGSGDDLGSITPANLASVLGVLNGASDIPSECDNDLNLIKKTSLYGTNGGAKHRPNSDWLGGFVVTIIGYIHSNAERGIQFWYDVSSTPNNLYVRYYTYNTGGTWYKITTVSV